MCEDIVEMVEVEKSVSGVCTPSSLISTPRKLDPQSLNSEEDEEDVFSSSMPSPFDYGTKKMVYSTSYGDGGVCSSAFPIEARDDEENGKQCTKENGTSTQGNSQGLIDTRKTFCKSVTQTEKVQMSSNVGNKELQKGSRTESVGEGNRKMLETALHSNNSLLVGELYKVLIQARNSKNSTEALRGIVHLVRDHIEELQDEMKMLHNEVRRERQLTEILVMEKECDVRLLQSELSAVRVVSEARAAALEAAEAARRSIEDDKEDLENRTASYNKELEKQNDAKQRLEKEIEEMKTTLLEMQEKHTVAVARLKGAQADAADAAEQLAQACDENARMAELLNRYEEEIISWETKASEWEKRETILLEEIEHLKELRNKAQTRYNKNLDVALLESKSQKQEDARMPTEEAKRKQVVLHSFSDDPDDVLGIEIASLRNKNIELETKVAENSHLDEVLQDLRRENASLRSAAQQSHVDAEKSKHELSRVQQEAKMLHAQLSHVIQSMSAAGVVESPGIYKELTFPNISEEYGRTMYDQRIKNLGIFNEDDAFPSNGFDTGRTFDVSNDIPLANEMCFDSESKPHRSSSSCFSIESSSRGPTTPISLVQSGLASDGKRNRRPESNASCDSVVEEVRAAMVSLNEDSLEKKLEDISLPAQKFMAMNVCDDGNQNATNQKPSQVTAGDLLDAFSNKISNFSRRHQIDSGHKSSITSPLEASSISVASDSNPFELTRNAYSKREDEILDVFNHLT